MVKKIKRLVMISIRHRIYLSFFLLVFLFMINGIASLITLSNNRKLADHIDEVITPALYSAGNFQDLLIESKLYTTSWVFLRANQHDKDALVNIHKVAYPELKQQLNLLFKRLDNAELTDSISSACARFEELLAIEQKIMTSLHRFEDYDDPVLKLEGERMVEDEVLPRTASLKESLDVSISFMQDTITEMNESLQHSFAFLKKLIISLGIIIICLAVFLSFYMTRIIISPIDKIRHIVNDLGKGIINRVNADTGRNEIGQMVRSVNSLSDKLRATAQFAQQVGKRNFNASFEPLSDDDTLGKSLINMRDNLNESEHRLMEATSQIQTIFDAIQDAVIIIDEEGMVVKWDEKSESMFGWKEAEIIGTTLSEAIIPHEHRNAHVRGMQHFLKTKEGPILNKTIEVVALRKNGDKFDISLSISSSLTNGRYNFIGFIRDITSRKRAEAELRNSEEKYRQIVETAQEGIWVTDEANRTTFINRKMCDIIGYTSEEIMEKSMHQFMGEEKENGVTDQFERRKNGISETYDASFVTKTGKIVWASISTNPVFGEDGKYIGSLAMVTDITRRKLDEILLKKSEHSLESKNKELEIKNRELEQFAYVASHDLQEPLRTTTSFVELLQKQYHGKLDARANKYLAYLVQSSDRMRALIKDLLDYSRIGGKKEREVVDINTTIKNVLADIDIAVKEAKAKIDFDRLPVLNGYGTELKQLFQNLLINAIKFRKKDTLPLVKITAERKEASWEFAVKDNGIGIDEEFRERVFIIFQRLHTRNEYDGSGIGLAHCKKIVGLHGGRIWIESVVGEGTTFHFTIAEKIN